MFLQEGGEKERNLASIAAMVHCEAMTSRLYHSSNECLKDGGRGQKKARGVGGCQMQDCFLHRE